MDNTYDDNKDDAFVVTVSRRDDIRPIFAVRFSRSGDEAKKKKSFSKNVTLKIPRRYSATSLLILSLFSKHRYACARLLSASDNVTAGRIIPFDFLVI